MNNREKAIAWSKTIPDNILQELCVEHLGEFRPWGDKTTVSNITGREIEMIWNAVVLNAGKLEDKHLVYFDDYMYLPIQYKGHIVEQPYYKGDGCHSVAELEKICNQFKEYLHQQAVIKQNCMKHIVELKFNIKF